jgi:beta-phosphoglucomutase
MSGKPRYAGARDALEYFGVPDAGRRPQEYGDRKQAMIVELIEASQFHAYPDALRFVLAVKRAGMVVAAASSSKNAGAFLRLVRLDEFAEKEGLSYDFLRPGYTLLDILDADVSGRDFEQGKPHPEIFLTAAEELGLPPAECFVVEDAANGVQAAKAGNMAALGLARADDQELLAAANADLVVTSLDDVSLDALAEGRLEQGSIR